MKITLFSFITALSVASASTSFYPFTSDLERFGDYPIRKVSNSQPYIIGGPSAGGKIVRFTLNDDGSLIDSDGDYVYYNSNTETQYFYPSTNGTIQKVWSIDPDSKYLLLNGGNGINACPQTDDYAYWATGISNCGTTDSSVPVSLSVDTAITIAVMNAAPKFTLHANTTDKDAGDGFLRIGSLAPYAYSIGGSGDLAEFTLLPNHRIFDQKDFLAVNTYPSTASPLGEIIRYGETLDISAWSTFVLYDNFIFTSTQPDDDFTFDDIEEYWYLCKNGSTPFVNYGGQCLNDQDIDYTPPLLFLELNYTGSSITTSRTTTGSSSASASQASTITRSATTTSGIQEPTDISSALSGTGNNSGTGVQTVTNTATTLMTITSCSENKCHTTAVPASWGPVTTTIAGEVTVYTTWCPLSSETTFTKASTTDVTITSCFENKCQETAVEATWGPITTTSAGIETVYTTWCPASTEKTYSTESTSTIAAQSSSAAPVVSVTTEFNAGATKIGGSMFLFALSLVCFI